jgi:HTH-type transcriptional regulator/antitoxin HipB
MEATVLIRTTTDFGAIIRDRRKQLGLDQAALAERIGVSRQWVIGIERGHARAELALVLRALDSLALRLDAKPDPNSSASSEIDDILNAARKVAP